MPAPGTGHELLKRELHRVRVQRHLAMSLPTLPGLGNLLVQRDLASTVPRRVDQTLMRIG